MPCMGPLPKHKKNIKKVKSQAIRFIFGLKGREVSISHQWELPLREGRNIQGSVYFGKKCSTITQKIQALSQQSLPMFCPLIFSKTRSQSQNLPNSTCITSRTNVFHFSFIPRTIRDIHD
jgi:hypothetical protein